MKFVNLYVETEYSMLKSTIKLSKLVERAKNNKDEFAAICDEDVMYGAFKFYNLCINSNIKPIIGLSVCLGTNNRLLLFARNYHGYQNLMAISTIIKTNDSNITFESIQKYSNDLILIIPSDESLVFNYYFENDLNKTKELIKLYQRTFDHVYMGFDLQGTIKKNQFESLLNYCNENNLKQVAINKTTFLDDSDFKAYKMLRCIEQNTSEYNETIKETFQNYLSEIDANYLFNDYKYLLENTMEIASLCDLSIDIGKYHMPVFLKDGNQTVDSKSYLKDLCSYGLSKRIKSQNVNKKLYLDRLLYELDVINKMGFNDYFLIVYDFINYSKKNNIMVGPGRGSGPGSLVAYSLGITEVDPIKYNLLFERFLNPERITMPDIDTDFADNKREEVIRYVGKKYGINHVAHISTFGTFGVRSAIRDVSRIMKIPDLFLNEVIKLIANNNLSLKEVLKNNDKLQMLMNNNENVKEMLLIASSLEGLVRNVSVHAAGIIMTKEDLLNFTPLQKGLNGLYQTQYEADDLQTLGLLKMDFLGIRNLSIIDEVLKDIKESLGIDININDIPLDDNKTYELIASGDTDGIFQLESQGMRNVIRKMKPNNILDIVNLNALYRPGPMDMIDTFINRKNGKEEIKYLHNDLKDILAPTYGIIVFQEQIMLIARKFAGYSLGEADVLRRAVSKKKMNVLIDLRKKFVESSIKNGYDEKTSNNIYDYIVKFANYGFNKSHSLVYSLISYKMAYLKVHYYQYFMANLISNSIGSVSLVKSYVSNCLKKKIKVMPPSINHSINRCHVEENKIFYPLIGIQNIGYVIVTDLIKERSRGMFSSFSDFINRTKKIINKRIFENLVFSGALDEFKLTKKAMISSYEEVLGRTEYSLLIDQFTDIQYCEEEYSFDIVCAKEYEALGFNLKYDIVLKYLNLKVQENCRDINSLEVKDRCKILGVIKDIKIIKTKKNEEMAFIQIYDETQSIDGVIFPNIFKIFKNNLIVNNVYLFDILVDNRNNKKQIILENIYIIK